jgi:hypothetical protein
MLADLIHKRFEAALASGSLVFTQSTIELVEEVGFKVKIQWHVYVVMNELRTNLLKPVVINITFISSKSAMHQVWRRNQQED